MVRVRVRVMVRVRVRVMLCHACSHARCVASIGVLTRLHESLCYLRASYLHAGTEYIAHMVHSLVRGAQEGMNMGLWADASTSTVHGT